MKIDEAINILKQYIDYNNPDVPDFYTMEEACEVVIKALEQEHCDDCIRRSDMLDAVGHGTTYTSEEVQDIIDGMPSVTPQPCDDTVSRHGVAEILLKYAHSTEGKAFAEFLVSQINALPSVIPQPKMGKWLYNKKEDSYRCSLCGFPCHKDNLGAIPTEYCAGCGAVMEVQNDKRTGN